MKRQIFLKTDGRWLNYVANNRLNANAADDFDIVIGPVANDRTLPVISAYIAGIFTEEDAIKRLLPQRLNDQYAFKTEHALRTLKYKEVVVI